MKIVLSVAVVTALILSACSGEKQEEKVVKQEVKQEVEPVKQEVTKVVEQEVEPIKQEVTKVDIASDAIADALEEVVDNAKVEVENVVAVVESQKDGIVSSVASNVAEITDLTKEKVIAVAEEVIAVASASTIDAGALYKSCKGCHGAIGEKKALNKSAVIKGWDASKVVEALTGYKDGTYGGAMKGMMKGQVSKLSEDDIKALAEHISKF